MRYLLLLLFTIIPVFLFSQDKSDSISIVKLLKDDYSTMGNWNIAKHMQNCTENYLLIEEGEIWNMEKERKYYIENANRTIERKDYFDIKYVRVYANTAYAVYNLRSDIRENSVLKVKNWNESAIFRKIKGVWKIELIHSTPVSLNTK